MNDYNFKKFTKIGSRLSSYSISFNGKSYSFGFNSGFYAKEEINQYKKVVLFYDKEKKVVAFRFINEDEKGAFTLVHSTKGKTGSITAKSFIIDNELNKEEYYGKKIPEKINYDNLVLYVIHLLDSQDKVE